VEYYAQRLLTVRDRQGVCVDGQKLRLLFLNVGHFVDHMFMLIFAKAAFSAGLAFGLAEGGGNVGWRLGANGVWGNMGVAAAPLITGFILAGYDWRLAFMVPGVISVLIGVGFMAFVRSGRARAPEATAREKAMVGFAPGWKRALLALAMVTGAGGFVFGTMTFVIPRMFEVSMPGVSVDVAVTGTLAAIVYAVAAFAQLIVGRIIDKRRVKPVLVTVAIGQPVLIALMALQTDYALFFSAVIAMGFVFGQIPITDAVLARYVPEQWRAKALSVKFMLNLVIGALALLSARTILASGGGFDMVMVMLAGAASLIVLAALLLPARSGAEWRPPPPPPNDGLNCRRIGIALPSFQRIRYRQGL